MLMRMDGCTELSFDTGLTARAFAQAKLAQFITEPGLIVHLGEAPPRIEFWKASGVREVTGADDNPTMVIWGPPVEGERLSALLDQSPENALAAVSQWIQAVLALGENPPHEIPLWPSAAIITPAKEGGTPSVFFAPPTLIKRSISANDERYVNPALGGMEAAAFTAAAMLYRILAGTPPFSAANTTTLHEDMRDGNFLPVRFAVPGLDSRLAVLIQNALERTAPNLPTGKELLGAMLESAALPKIAPLAEPDRQLLEKEKAQYLKLKTASISTRRFVARNTAVLGGALGGVVIAIFIVYSIISSRALLPTTAGMEPAQVIESYYHAFGAMNHQMMEACVIGDAGKNDINAAVHLFVMSKTRQAYEHNAPPLVFPAHEWQGGELPEQPLFGATDLRITFLGGDETGGKRRYQVDYTFWVPEQLSDTESLSPNNPPSIASIPTQRRDYLTLIRKKGNWRIAELTRE